MNSKMKQWVALTGVGVLAVLAAGWFLLVSPKRGEAAQVRDDVASQDGTNSSLQTQLAMLKAQAKTLPMQQAKLALVAAKIPDNPALPALIRALSTAAADAGVELVSMSPSAPTPVTTAVAAIPAGSKPTAGAPTTLSSTAGAGSAYATGQLTSISLAINVVGGYFQVEQFFDRVENLSRAAKVTAFTLAPGTNPLKVSTATNAVPVESGKSLAANITANVYMAVGRGAAAAPIVPGK